MVEVAQSADLLLENEHGEIVEVPLDVHDFVKKAVVAADDTSLVLKEFDLYGDLRLDASRMDDFLKDWADAERLVVSSQERDTWDTVQRLARRVAEERSLVIRLSGD